jgi:hypothetical protein
VFTRLTFSLLIHAALPLNPHYEQELLFKLSTGMQPVWYCDSSRDPMVIVSHNVGQVLLSYISSNNVALALCLYTQFTHQSSAHHSNTRNSQPFSHTFLATSYLDTLTPTTNELLAHSPAHFKAASYFHTLQLLTCLPYVFLPHTCTPTPCHIFPHHCRCIFIIYRCIFIICRCIFIIASLSSHFMQMHIHYCIPQFSFYADAYSLYADAYSLLHPSVLIFTHTSHLHTPPPHATMLTCRSAVACGQAVTRHGRPFTKMRRAVELEGVAIHPGHISAVVGPKRGVQHIPLNHHAAWALCEESM